MMPTHIAIEPAIMNFREIYGLTGKACKSRLASRNENLYAPWKFGVLGRWVEKRLTRVTDNHQPTKTGDI